MINLLFLLTISDYPKFSLLLLKVYKAISDSLRKLQNNEIHWVNPYHAEFHKWKNPPSIFGTFHYHFQVCIINLWMGSVYTRKYQQIYKNCTKK